MSQATIKGGGAFTRQNVLDLNANFSELYAGGTGETFVSPTITGTVLGGATYAAPVFTTPTLGVAAATSVNKVAITAPTTSATLTIADGKTLTASNTLTLAGTDATTMTFPTTSATLARTDAANTFTGVQTMTSPVLVTPAIGVATGTSLAVTGLLKSSSPSAGLGYATGAGGTGTQATDKTTTVVMSPNPCLCGSITTQASNLVAATIVAFTVTDSAVAATDAIIINHLSGGTIGSYTVNASAGAGSFVVRLRNNTAGDLAEALVLTFSVIKAVTA